MSTPRAGRPLGELSRALLRAAQQGPGSVRQLAERSQVGYDTARVKASHLVRMGHLQVVSDDRPMVLATAQPQPQAGHENAFELLMRGFWPQPDGLNTAAD